MYFKILILVNRFTVRTVKLSTPLFRYVLLPTKLIWPHQHNRAVHKDDVMSHLRRDPEACVVVLLARCEWVSEDEDDRVSAQEHLGDVAVLVDGLRLLLALAHLWHLSPHLLHVLQHHVAVSADTHTQHGCIDQTWG